MTQGSKYGKQVVLRPKNCNSLKHFGALFRHELIWNLRCFVHFLLHLLILSKRNLKLTHFCASFCFSCTFITFHLMLYFPFCRKILPFAFRKRNEYHFLHDNVKTRVNFLILFSPIYPSIKYIFVCISSTGKF